MGTDMLSEILFLADAGIIAGARDHDGNFAVEIKTNNPTIESKDIDPKDLADSLGRFLYYEGIHYRTEEAYVTAIETFFGNLKKYLLPESKLIEEIKKRIKYYQNQYCGSEE